MRHLSGLVNTLSMYMRIYVHILRMLKILLCKDTEYNYFGRNSKIIAFLTDFTSSQNYGVRLNFMTSVTPGIVFKLQFIHGFNVLIFFSKFEKIVTFFIFFS